MHPLGAPGTRLVSDILIDAKVPASLRPLIHVVATPAPCPMQEKECLRRKDYDTDKNVYATLVPSASDKPPDAIVWLPGIAVAAPFAVLDPTQPFHALHLMPFTCTARTMPGFSATASSTPLL